jgi:hypothetical protein
MGMRRPTYRPDGGDGRPASHAAAAALVVGEQQHAVLEVGAEDAVLVAEEAGSKVGQQRGEPRRATLHTPVLLPMGL